MNNKSPNEESERAVSPVIGVILMVAITVILAAVIAAFVLDIGDTSANPQAGFTIDEDSGESIDIQVNNIDRLDDVRIANVDEEEDSIGDIDAEVGSTAELDTDTSDFEMGDTIQIIGEYDGGESVLRTIETED